MNHYLVGLLMVFQGERERARRWPFTWGLELVVVVLLVAQVVKGTLG